MQWLLTLTIHLDFFKYIHGFQRTRSEQPDSPQTFTPVHFTCSSIYLSPHKTQCKLHLYSLKYAPKHSPALLPVIFKQHYESHFSLVILQTYSSIECNILQEVSRKDVPRPAVLKLFRYRGPLRKCYLLVSLDFLL